MLKASIGFTAMLAYCIDLLMLEMPKMCPISEQYYCGILGL